VPTLPGIRKYAANESNITPKIKNLNPFPGFMLKKDSIPIRRNIVPIKIKIVPIELKMSEKVLPYS
ncbi:unnamed protein product, partial [marine sediment metagenome]